MRSVKLRFMDQTRNWQDQWPPIGNAVGGVPSGSPDALSLRPLAVEITVDLEDWGAVTRVVEVSG